MPRGKRAIGDIIRGTRDDSDMADAVADLDLPKDDPVSAGSHDDPVNGNATTTTTTFTIPTPPDIDPARRLLFVWSLRRFLETKPPSTVVTIPRTATVGEAMAALARHGILSAPVIDEKNLHFHGFLSCLDILHAFVDGLDPALTRSSYVQSRTREQRMAELDSIAEDFLSSRSTKVRTSPDGKLVYKGHGDDATLLDVVSHGFFHRDVPDEPHGSNPRPVHVHCATIEPAPPLTTIQRDARREAAEQRAKESASSDFLADFNAEDGRRRAPPRDVAEAIETEAFVRTVGVCHRVAVFEMDDAEDAMRVVAIVSQLDVLRFLSRKVDALGKLAEASLAELGLVGNRDFRATASKSNAQNARTTNEAEPTRTRVGMRAPRVPPSATRTTVSRSGSVVTASWDRTALECFKLMRDRNVSALGVVDRSGELVANLSASDLRRLDQESFRLLALPVAEFISRRKGDAIGRRDAPFAEARRLLERDGVDWSDFEDRAVETSKAAGGGDAGTAEAAWSSPISSDSNRTFVELVFARETTSLKKVLGLFARHGKHHVSVVDEQDAPVAVLTPTDILRLVAVEDEDSKWRDAWHGGGDA